jgi:hypothetical protein
MSATTIKARLLQVQADEGAIRTQDVSRLEGSIEELCKLQPNELADRLLEWEPIAPDAVNLLLLAAARSDRGALSFARALVQLLTTWKDGIGPWLGVDEVLLRAFPQLAGPERDWVAERTAVRQKYSLVPGTDFVPMGEPRDEDQWPADRPLPPLDSARGVQARLLRAGYNCGPITGEWNEATRRALVRYQVEKAIRASGELDEPTRIRLADEE